MALLTPALSSELADAVYELSRANTLGIALIRMDDRFGDIATFSESVLLKAKTGGPLFIKCRTAFGFTLIGKGAYEGHAFFLFRGTQYLADWLTNLNVGVSPSTSGQSVHDGFNMSFKTMKPKLQEFMAEISKKKITHIHCIGHSLGGALATICADWIRSGYKHKPYLYTFGSPRVGLTPFASQCTSRIGAPRIFRVFHKTDIVPCIPTWPYVHTPNKGTDYFLPSPGFFPSAEYHGMSHYIKSVAGQNWPRLASFRYEKKTEFSILNWLKSQTLVGLTTQTLEWLNSALVYVLEKCFAGASWLIANSTSTSFTLMDRLAYMLSRPQIIMTKVSDLVLLLINKMMQVVGNLREIKKEDLNREFIRNVLIRLQQRANEYAQKALGKVLVEGRQI